MLFYLEPFFMQVLEGEEAMVNELFNLINKIQDTTQGIAHL